MTRAVDVVVHLRVDDFEGTGEWWYKLASIQSYAYNCELILY
jgi:hypothetical protein